MGAEMVAKVSVDAGRSKSPSPAVRIAYSVLLQSRGTVERYSYFVWAFSRVATASARSPHHAGLISA